MAPPSGDARVALLERPIDHAPLLPPASLPLSGTLVGDRRAESEVALASLGFLPR